MLTKEEVRALDDRLQTLQCIDPATGDGLFGYIFLGEPNEQASRYEPHLADCEYCRVAKSLYRYKREAGLLWGRARDEAQKS